MGLADFTSVLKDVPTLLALKKGLKSRPDEESDCFSRRVTQTAQKYKDRVAVVFEGTHTTWGDLNSQANGYATALNEYGIGRGDVVSVMMENRTEFLSTIIAINKIGAVAALINTNLRETPLRHCISVTDSKICIFGTELNEALEGVRTDLSIEEKTGYLAIPDAATPEVPDWATNLKDVSSNLSTSEPSSQYENTLGETAFYIFTSGTTGLPKAAVMSNKRFLKSAQLSYIAGLRCTYTDAIYLCLPLYHGTGLIIGVGPAFLSGARVVLRRRFSASRLLEEVRLNNVTHLIYVGELCRYLYNSPVQPADAHNSLHTIMGNGLRPDIWASFKERFGIDRVTEFYGSSEGNIAFANILNKDCTIGLTGSKIALIKYDIDSDEIVRTPNGKCQEVEEGEAGLCIGHINPNDVFEGYTDSEATEKKILRNVFEDGDAWFNTGDLLKEVKVGFTLGYPHYQFVDRVGDTYRWRSENVSTNEVGEILNAFDDVEISNVFGVTIPGTEGRAGMAALCLKEGVQELDVPAFSDYVVKNLPPFARPVFVRKQTSLEMTGTLKLVKKDIQREGYDISKVADPIYVMKPGADSYTLLDEEYAHTIQKGDARF